MSSIMDPRRWETIRAAFEELVELDAVGRASQLAALGSTDPELRAAVESLLAADTRAERRLAPLEAVLLGAPSAAPDPLGLAGRTVSHFRVLEPLGAGGMGVVYRAEDTRLGRAVALKFLPPPYSLDAAAKARFLHEAHAAGALDHPNLCTIHEVGESDYGRLFLAMALYPGETLKTRLARDGPLPVEQALEIARQIAQGLRCAHAAGIVHRDLKPGNVMLLPDGTVKILDFGLAKAWDESLSASGARLGTASYMAPEQVRGDLVDGRTDLWALGVVLYEMLTGRKPFGEGDELAIARAILNDEPDRASTLRTGLLGIIDDIVATLLEKDSASRYATAAEFLDGLAAATAIDVPTPRRSMWRRRLLGGRRRRRTAVALGVAAAAVASWWGVSKLGTHATAKSSWFDLALPDSAAPRSEDGASIALSPDGSIIAYIGSSTQSVFVRPLDELLPRRLAGSEGARCPSFSPDGEWVVFTSRGRLKKVAVRGGLPIVISESTGLCGVWTDRNEILFDLRRHLYRVSADGGPISLVARPDTSKRIARLIPSQALPDGKRALIQLTETPTFDWQLGLVSLPDGQITKLTPKSGLPRFGPRYSNGYLVFGQGNGGIVAAPFSLRTLRFTGPEVALPLQDTITDFTTAENGSLAYLSSAPPSLSLVAVREDGQTRILSGNIERSRLDASAVIPLDTAYYSWPRLSPDGKRVALEIHTGPFTWDVWVYDIASRTLTRLTNNFTGVRPSGWTADGRSVVFIALDSASLDRSHRLESHRVASQPWDGSAPPHTLMRLPVPVHDISLGPPHGYAAFSDYDGNDIWIAPLDTPTAARPLVATPAWEREPRLSHDGRLMAYTSNETGRPEVYVRSVPGPAGRLQVSAGGGTQPVWSTDERQLYYRGPEYMMRAAIARGSELSVTRRDTLFRDMFATHNVTNYDVFPGGKELLMIRMKFSSVHAAILLNWSELLRQRAMIR